MKNEIYIYIYIERERERERNKERTHPTPTARNDSAAIENEKRIPEKDAMNGEDKERSEIEGTK